MGGLSSKKFKLHKDKKVPGDQKRSSVAGVQYRDKEFQLARETTSAYYYGNAKVETKTPEPSGSSVDAQKRVVLRKGAGSDHTLFRRVRETPTAVYYVPNDDDDADIDFDKHQEGDMKNIVLENPTMIAEETIHVIRDGSSGIIIRSGDPAKDVNDKKVAGDDSATKLDANAIDEKEEDEDKKKEKTSDEGAEKKEEQKEDISTATCDVQKETLIETETVTTDQTTEISPKTKEESAANAQNTASPSADALETADLSHNNVEQQLSQDEQTEHQDNPKGENKTPTEEVMDQSSAAKTKADGLTAVHEPQEKQFISDAEPLLSTDKVPTSDQASAATGVSSDVHENGLVSNENDELSGLNGEDKTKLLDRSPDDIQTSDKNTEHQENIGQAVLDTHILHLNTLGETNEVHQLGTEDVSPTVAVSDHNAEPTSSEQNPAVEGFVEAKETDKVQPLTDEMPNNTITDES